MARTILCDRSLLNLTPLLLSASSTLSMLLQRLIARTDMKVLEEMEEIIGNLAEKGEKIETLQQIRDLIFEIQEKHKQREKEERELARKQLLAGIIPNLGKQQRGASE